MQIACVQLDIAWEDKEANYRQVESRARAAELPPGSLLVLPEMFAVGFSMNAARLTEPADGPTAAFVSQLASRYSLYVIAGAPVFGPSGRPRNEALVFGPDGRLIVRYAKNYPFSGAEEGKHYEAGSELACFDWHGCRVTPTICYDLRFPELYRRTAGRTDLFVAIASWPVARGDHWVALLKARAIENQAFVAGVNRCGRDPAFQYPGRTQIIDAGGKVLADAGDGEGLIHADLDLEAMRQYRKVFRPLDDIRRAAP